MKKRICLIALASLLSVQSIVYANENIVNDSGRNIRVMEQNVEREWENVLQNLLYVDIVNVQNRLEDASRNNPKLSQEEENKLAKQMILKEYKARIMDRSGNQITDYVYSKLTKDEVEFAKKHPIAFVKIVNAGVKAKDMAETLFENDGLYNGNGDAFRHALWNALMVTDFIYHNGMTLSEAVSITKEYTDAHESSDDNNEQEKEMDLYNKVGINVAIERYKENSSEIPTDEQLSNLIQNKLYNGELKRIVNNKVVWTGSKSKWVNEGGKWYYYNAQGKLETEWLFVDGKYYYLGSDGIMRVGWQKISGVWYYLDASGVMQTGWNKVDNVWYYLDDNGAMQVGWKEISGTWYYLNSSGQMQTGWQYINNNWYYLNSDGAMQTGWLRDGDNWYYLNETGEMHVGWKTVSGKKYYLNYQGHMVTGEYIISGDMYEFGSQGELIRKVPRDNSRPSIVLRSVPRTKISQ